jgi:hypothetical protein
MENDELLERAAFGKQVELFWGSRVGSYLRDRAQECYTAAIVQLKTHDPTDAKGMQHLQNEIWKAEEFERWLSEAVLDGMKSLEILESDDNE